MSIQLYAMLSVISRTTAILNDKKIDDEQKSNTVLLLGQPRLP